MIWLLRHAHAAPGHPDEARPLTEKGIGQARVAGLALRKLGVQIDACLSSPKVRAHDTARLACEALGLDITIAPELSGAARFDPVAVAAGYGEAMLVGHDPTISQALHDATGARAHMRKGGVAGIDDGQLVVLLTPRELAAIAGIAVEDAK